MQLFTTYYHNIPISFYANLNEEFCVNQMLKNPKLAHFFEDDSSKTFISAARINDLKYINRYMREVNNHLEIDDCFFGYFETFSAKRSKSFRYKIPIISYLIIFLEFIFLRILPKLKYINTLYFFITKGKNRLLSKAEVLGRLVYNGFEILKVESIDGLTYFKVRKKSGHIQKEKTSYGLIFKMKRIGKNGEFFNVYKFRTMHPYSEFIQDYVMNEQGFAASGKFERDFRITPWGKWMRKYWIDELPQLMNLIIGNMKLVGVRPVTESYFNILPEELKKSRIQYKPGCIPPYVSLNVKSTVDEVIEAERNYLERKKQNPFTTDLKFFFYALVNIIFKGKRSA